MQYEVIRQNDDGSAQIRMTIDGHVLEQAIDPSDLDNNAKQAMAVFKSELDRKVVSPPIDISTYIGEVQTVEILPEIPAEDLEPEQSIATEE